MSFAGKRVLALESRRAKETAELIVRHGGDALVAPSMREVPIEKNAEAFEFAERLFRGEFDMVIFLTGVGTRFLAKLIGTRFPEPAFAEGLRKVTLVARGPKPTAALREMDLKSVIIAPEPNTWREVLSSIEGRPERKIAIQEYGKPSDELYSALRERGAEVTAVRVYQWELPEDLKPLQEAARQLADGMIDVTLFTTGTQLVHLLQVADDMHLRPAVEAGLRATRIASIGPTTSETLVEHGFEAGMEPTHPKLGLLVKEAAEWADGGE